MKKNLVNNVRDTFNALIITGAGLYFTGCNNENIPSFEIHETKIEDKYSKEKSNDLAKQMDEELKEIQNYHLDVDNPSDREEWKGYVQKSLIQIDKSNSMAIRSYFENKNYIDNYDNSNDATKNWLDNRVHNLFYNNNKSFSKMINTIDIDAFAQIVKEGDSLSVFEYNESTHKLSEYKMKFAEGADFNDFGAGPMLTDRIMLLEIYDHDYETLTGKTTPKLSSAHTRTVNIEQDQTSLKEIIYGK